MQAINTIHRFTTTCREMQPDRSEGSSRNFTVYLFCLLHLAILVTAGYFITQRDLSSATKLVFLAIACFTSVWLLYQYFKPSSLRSA